MVACVDACLTTSLVSSFVQVDAVEMVDAVGFAQVRGGGHGGGIISEGGGVGHDKDG